MKARLYRIIFGAEIIDAPAADDWPRYAILFCFVFAESVEQALEASQRGFSQIPYQPTGQAIGSTGDVSADFVEGSELRILCENGVREAWETGQSFHLFTGFGTDAWIDSFFARLSNSQ